MFVIENDAINAKRIDDLLRFLKIEDLDFVAKRDGELFGYNITKDNGKALIQYGEPCDFFRALLYISQNGVVDTHQKRRFEKLGYMIDVARNAVPKIETIKKMVDYLAVLGYNRAYLYLEDLFEVQGEPFFGYLRGRYAEEELKELDDYCAEVGMELVPCIQVLAHLNAIFKWPEYEKCLDTADILLVNEDRTYTLIQNMFETVSRVFRTKTLHIGMDEAHLVGRGRYLDKHGYKTGYEVMAEHIKKVAEMAEPFGFDLMIWSDMYFRLAFGGAYCSLDGGLPEEISAQIPDKVTLTYWDYFTRDYPMLSHMMNEHLKTGRGVAFAGGAWKWTGWNPSTKFSFLTSQAALEVCRECDVKNIMLTAWADDGAEASLFSTLPVIIYYAEACYNEEVLEEKVDSLLKALFGLSLEDFYSADMPLITKEEFEENDRLGKLPKILLYNDPLSGAYDSIIAKYNIEAETIKYANKLKVAKENAPKEFKYIFENLENLCRVLQYKATLGVDIRKAYKANDLKSLSRIAAKRIPALIKELKNFEKGFCKQWMLENKGNGYQTHDLRLGGLMKRLQTVKILLQDFVAGRIKEIHELKDELLPIEGEAELIMLYWKVWAHIHSVYVV